MKRLHIHVSVEDLAQSVRFYSALFGAEPIKLKQDYAKWLLDDPHMNFAISARGSESGLDHFGIQVDSAAELQGLREQMKRADLALHDEGETVCCYAKSDKSWLEDPSGIAWEAYHNMDEAAFFHEAPGNACCAPTKAEAAPVTSCAPKSGCC